MAWQNFGRIPYGTGVFGGNNTLPPSLAWRLLQRLPRGLAFSGKHIHALFSAFEEEFSYLRACALEASKSDFWAQTLKERGVSLSLPYIELLLSAAGISGVSLYHSTGKREYTTPVKSRRTYFGHGRFNQGRTPDALPTAQRSQFGRVSHAHIDPRNYPHGLQIGGGQIDHLLNTFSDGQDAQAQGVFGALSDHLLQNRFVYYACSSRGGFMEYPVEAAPEEITALKRILLSCVPFGLFGILLLKNK